MPQTSTDSVTWKTVLSGGANSYTPAQIDEGAHVRVIITATNTYGSATVTSGATTPVLINPPVNAVAPVVTGIPQRTNILMATTGTWTGPGCDLRLHVAVQHRRAADAFNTSLQPWAMATRCCRPTKAATPRRRVRHQR